MQDATNPKTDFSYPNSETFIMRIDVPIPPLNDRRMREALNLAIDRDAFIGTILPEGRIARRRWCRRRRSAGTRDLKSGPIDPEQAKALIAEAKADGRAGRQGDQDHRPHQHLPERHRDHGSDARHAAGCRPQRDAQMYEVAEWEDFYSKPFAEDRAPQLIQVQHDNAKGDPVFTMFFKYHTEGPQSVVPTPRSTS